MSEGPLTPFNGGRSPYCATCNGAGTAVVTPAIPEPFPSDDVTPAVYGPCPDCAGTGRAPGG